MTFLRPSKWTFVTSNGGNVATGIFGVEGGSITLAEPDTAREEKFAYGGVGVGLSAGFKLPKLSHLSGAGASSESLPSMGRVCMTSQFPGKELTVADINGGCTFVEVSGGIAWGHSGYMLSVGINPASLGSGVANSMLMPMVLQQARGYIMFRGWNFGLQAGVGASSFIGWLHAV